MAGPLAFLAGLLMVGGAAASAASERNAYRMPKTYTNGHPDFTNINSFTRQEIMDMVKYSKPQSLYGNTRYHKSPESVRPLGGLDVDRIEKEIGHDEAMRLIQNWLILELGYSTTIDEEKMKKYCWSGDYMSPYLSAALGMRQKYPTLTLHLLKEKYREITRNANFNRIVNKWESETYEGKKVRLNAVLQRDYYHDIENKVIPTLEGLELAKQIKNNVRINIGNHDSINLEHTGGKSLALKVSPDLNFEEGYKSMDSSYKGPKEDYVDYLKWLYKDRNDFVLNEEKTREVFKDNSYLKLCQQNKDAALEFAKKYVIEDYGLNAWDVCQILKTAPMGLQYSDFNRKWSLGMYFICRKIKNYESRISQERYLEINRIYPYHNEGFEKSEIDKLNELFYQNLSSMLEQLCLDDDFLCDFLTCLLVESRTMNIKTLLHPKPIWMKSPQQMRKYNAEIAKRKKTVKALAIARQRARSCVTKIPEAKEPQLRLRDSSDFQN